jgi:hypothetical protein
LLALGGDAGLKAGPPIIGEWSGLMNLEKLMWYFGPEDAALKGGPERYLWPALQGGVFTTLFPQGS